MPTLTHSIDAALQDGYTATISINANLSATKTASHSINAAKSLTRTAFPRIDCAILGEAEEYVTGTQLLVRYMTKNPSLAATTAKYITDIFDLDSNTYKHIKSVYLAGDYGNNQITLSWTKTPDYSTWSTLSTKTQDSITYGDTVVWYNLGQTRRMAYTIQWTGSDNITHDAIEVVYNIRTQ